MSRCACEAQLRFGEPEGPLARLLGELGRRFPAGPARAGVRVLKLGCEAGQLVQHLLDEQFEVYVVDDDARAVADLRTRAGLEHPRFQARQGMLTALDQLFPPRYFDAVLDVGCVQHFPREPSLRIYQALPALLKPTGLLLGLLSAQEGYLGFDWTLIEPGTYIRYNGRGPHLLHLFSREEIERMLGGFTHRHWQAIPGTGRPGLEDLTLWLVRGEMSPQAALTSSG